MGKACHDIVDQLLADPIANYPAATVACFDPTTGGLPRRSLDEERTVAFLEKLAAAGAPALLIAASTGHGHLRTVEELEQWFRVAARAQLGRHRAHGAAAAGRRRRGQSAAGEAAGGAGLCRRVRPARPRLAAAMPPTSKLPRTCSRRCRPRRRRAWPSACIRFPMSAACAMTPDAAAHARRRAGGERIVAIKVTEADYDASTLRFLQDPRLAQLKIVQGWDPHLARALRDGPEHDAQGRQRCGVTSGPMSFAVFQYLHILAAAERGDWDEVAAAQAAVTSSVRSRCRTTRRSSPTCSGPSSSWAWAIRSPAASVPSSSSRVLTRARHAAARRRPPPAGPQPDLMDDGPFHHGLVSLCEV